jgi:hypothetical protein
MQRQIIVGNAAAAALSVARPTPLTATTRARGEALVAATVPLHLYVSTNGKKVDNATDTVVVGFAHVLAEQERVLRDTVVPLGDLQRQGLAHVRVLRTRLFPGGTEYVKSSMDLQWSALVALRSAMQEPECSAAIDGLGLRPFADHVLAHIELYGRMVGQEGKASSAGAAEASAAWTEAFKRFAVQVMHDYPDDAAIQRELLGPYEAQLEQQRAAARARKAQAGAEQPAPQANPAPPAPPAGSAEQPAPTAPQAPPAPEAGSAPPPVS